VRNEVLCSAKKKRNILLTIERRKAKCIGHTLLRNCLLKHIIDWKEEGRIDVKERRRRRRKQLPDNLKEARGYWNFKEEAVDRTLWRTRF
jgi:hypothetical protein